MLSDKQWDKGVGRIVKEIEEAEAKGKEIVFDMDVSIYMNIGYNSNIFTWNYWQFYMWKFYIHYTN